MKHSTLCFITRNTSKFVKNTRRIFNFLLSVLSCDETPRLMLDILRLGNMTSSSFVLQECIFYCFVLFYLASLSLSLVKLCTYKSFSGRKEFMGLMMAFPILTSTVFITV